MFRLVIKSDIGFEFWADIPEYEGLYQASTYGRIRSVERTIISSNGKRRFFPSCILNPSNDSDGYYIISIHTANSRKRISKKVHRLVASTFLPKPTREQTQINHKSEIKTENQVWNLEWCSAYYNTNYGNRNKQAQESLRSTNKIHRKPVMQFDSDGNYIKTYQSIKEAKRITGFADCHIIDCCKGKKEHAYGYCWKYA